MLHANRDAAGVEASLPLGALKPLRAEHTSAAIEFWLCSGSAVDSVGCNMAGWRPTHTSLICLGEDASIVARRVGLAFCYPHSPVKIRVAVWWTATCESSFSPCPSATLLVIDPPLPCSLAARLSTSELSPHALFPSSRRRGTCTWLWCLQNNPRLDPYSSQATRSEFSSSVSPRLA